MKQKYFKFFTLAFFAMFYVSSSCAQVAKWTVLTYIAADNNLESFAHGDIEEMVAGMAPTQDCNVLVQWDQPGNNKTWRYKITPEGAIEVNSLTSDMGYNPENELVNSMEWAVTNFPAEHYALILWNHGSGIEDFSPAAARTGLRGILYDDSQGTCLTNQGLTSALVRIKELTGKNLDILATDACLMAMLEVVYQVKGLVDLFIGSEQTIPGKGYEYSKFIAPLSNNPQETTPADLAHHITSAYKDFYSNVDPTSDFTLSTIDVSHVDGLKENISDFVKAIDDCRKVAKIKTRKIVHRARRAATSFDMPQYIDLYSFYANILHQIKKVTPRSELILIQKLKKMRAGKKFMAALEKLKAVIIEGLNRIESSVLDNVYGPKYAGVKGVSIYYPRFANIHDSYLQTRFAQDNPEWVGFINKYI